MLDYDKLSIEFDELLDSYTASELVAHIERNRGISQVDTTYKPLHKENIYVKVQTDYVYSSRQSYFKEDNNSNLAA